jgi:hypothetical protein
MTGSDMVFLERTAATQRAGRVEALGNEDLNAGEQNGVCQKLVGISARCGVIISIPSSHYTELSETFTSGLVWEHSL